MELMAPTMLPELQLLKKVEGNVVLYQTNVVRLHNFCLVLSSRMVDVNIKIYKMFVWK